jgi:small-conductance mechanosensitive channel
MGIVGAAVVIALQDLCSSFAGWFVIVTSRKVKVGDRVEIEGHRGDIIDIQMLRTTLLELNNWLGVDEPTGRVVVVPNSFIFKSQVFNYSHVHPSIWGKVDITVTFETPAAKAYETLLRVLEEETKDEFEGAQRGGQKLIDKYGLVRISYEPHIHSVIDASGVTFSLFYVSHYRRYSTTRDKLVTRILAEFEKDPELNFAYPTERLIPTPEGGGFPVSMQKTEATDLR